MKILESGIAVLECDTHLSKWIQETGNLCHDEGVKLLAEFIPEGGTVIDVGACLGDHTTFYLECVGEKGTVIAIEPHPDSFECLKHNCPKATLINAAASDSEGYVRLIPNANVGASHLVKDDCGSIKTITIDSLNIERCDFIKIDVEGFEVHVLQGAKDTISRTRPVMMIEVNRQALKRAGFTVNDLIHFIQKILGYEWEIFQSNCKFEDPQYDVICKPPNS